MHIYLFTAANNKTTCGLGSYKHYICVGHGLHNLITKDGFKKSEAISELLRKLRQIVKALRYRVDEFERLSTDEEQFLSEMSKLGEDFFLFDEEDSEDDLTDEPDENNKKSKSLKLDVKTRWNSTVPMIESILSSKKSVVKLMLQKTDHSDLVLSNAEYGLLKELLGFLKNFEVITAIFSGARYATLNFYVLFRQEIRSLLEPEPQDSIPIKELKENMLQKVDYRFPLSDIKIIASLLDPRFQNLLDVKNYIKSCNCSSVEFIQKYCNNYDVIKSHSNPKVKNVPDCDVTKSGVKKSYIDDMVEKHSTLSSVASNMSSARQSELTRECFLLLSMGGVVEVKDILSFWKDNSKTMPLLSEVASATLCTPATSTPSERNFSVAGLVANSKKSQILPENLDKVCFIHNNYEFIKKNYSNLLD